MNTSTTISLQHFAKWTSLRGNGHFNAFRRVKRDAKAPLMWCFHSPPSFSTTYKLKLNHGDIKATQGDTGHSQADMVTKVYAHILDEDRKVNAQKFEVRFTQTQIYAV